MRGPCIVYGCKNDGVHQLPMDETLKTHWITAAKLDTQLKHGRSIKTYTYFCSDHFKDSDFYYTRPLFDGDTRNKVLKKGSIPSIFPWTPLEIEEAEVAQAKPTTRIENPEDNVRFDPCLAVNNYSKNIYPVRFVEELPFMEVDPSDLIKDPLELSHENNSEISASTCLAMKIEVGDLEPSIQSYPSSNRDIESHRDGCICSKFQTINNAPAFSVHTYKNKDKCSVLK